MVIENYKTKGNKYITEYAQYFSGWSPNSLTLLSFMFAALSFASFILVRYISFYFLFLCSVLILFAGFFDIMDGAVARISEKTSAKGDLLDHVLDRYSDLIIMAGFAISGLTNIYLVFFSMIGVLLTSYMGTQAQALGLNRLYSGFLTRADRLILFILFSFIEFIMLIPLFPYHYFILNGIHVTILDVLFVFLAIGSNFTAIQRFYIIWRHLPNRPL
ncbi:MAG: CDP-alcohol phosphatidyltransferase family protein [Candidatus Thermoplasmatota archaeon]|nr:CDP-alcohol phosphatidyltransferase family protein [Candidatus Thermoplasmatota archaeon]MCL5963588.1 CDP-alcohol phosphatidyltransferase family protein [Candidatus Thermoplasmatota archaeon]